MQGKLWDKIFSEWAKNFPPQFSVRYFEALIAAQLGQPVGYCKIDETWGSYLVLEHNGDVYPCDFFGEEDKKLGNLNQQPLQDIERTEQFISFAEAKSKLPKECENCEFLKFRRGGNVTEVFQGVLKVGHTYAKVTVIFCPEI